MASRSATVKIDVVMDDKPVKASVQNIEREVKKTGTSFSHMATLAKAGFAAIATSNIVGFLKDATGAAMEDERAQRMLALAMQNTVGATDEQIESTENMIDRMARATGVADDELRPAMGELVRTHGSVKEATDALGVAMDISAAKGLSLQAVSIAMGKAALGNIGALGRLGVATRDADGAMLSYDEVLAEAARTMGGSAAEAADTLEGRMRRMQVTTDEAKESIGFALMPVMMEAAEVGADVATIFDAVGGALASIGGSGETAGAGLELVAEWGVRIATLGFSDVLAAWADQLSITEDETKNYGGTLKESAESAEEFAAQQQSAAEAADALAEAIKGVVDEQMAQLSPSFAAFKVARDLQKATDDYNKALRDHGEASTEAQDAARRLLETHIEADATAALFAKNGGLESINAFKQMAIDAGINRDVIQSVIDTILQLNRTPITTYFPSAPSMGGTGSTRPAGETPKFHGGGVVPGPAGREVLAMLKGGETVLPTHDPSFSLTSKGSGSGTVINYYGGTQIGNERILKELLEMGRRG